MIKNLILIISFVLFMLFLSGCTVPFDKVSLSVDKIINKKEKIQSTQPEIKDIPLVLSIPQQPGFIEFHEESIQREFLIHYYKWEESIESLINQMIQTQDINLGSLLLIDSIVNRTNISINTELVTENLRDILSKSGKFILISKKQCSLAKEQLGLSPKDSLGIRSKTIGIAHSTGAQYLLCSILSGSINMPILQLKLILVQTQTGEIVWSGRQDIPKR